MPGRDELIQQNIARAQANSQAPRPQESQGKSPTGGLAAPKSFLGGNFDVYSSLERVEFQGALGDASMRGNIAYIRLWKRGSTSQQTSSSVPASEVSEDPLTNLQSELWDVQGSYGSAVALDYLNAGGYDAASLYDESAAAFNDNSYASSIGLTDRQEFLATQTPKSSSSGASQASPIAVFSPSPPPKPNAAVGAVKPANPNGFVNAFSRVGKSLLGVAAGKPSYVGGANSGNTVSQPSGEMMWQFLFNPSELELEVGPEFKNAEAWGVSDKANSGQPLHWSHNKNALLKFNSVLLNGFVFGRKVEALEQGLVELFMARDGEGQAGPHVLEFVWGKRVFGPCVIKNINIKEKMWDEGHVVNAEVSFTLEQVPEWTINDGFVDVARPGRIGLEGQSTTPGSSASNPTGTTPAGTSSPTNQPNGSPRAGSGAQKPTSANAPSQSGSFYPQSECDSGRRVKANFEKLASSASTGPIGYFFGVDENSTAAAVNKYATIYNSFGSVLNTLPLDPNCKAKCAYRGQSANNNRDLACARDCSRQAANLLNNRYNTGKCLAQTLMQR